MRRNKPAYVQMREAVGLRGRDAAHRSAVFLTRFVVVCAVVAVLVGGGVRAQVETHATTTVFLLSPAQTHNIMNIVCLSVAQQCILKRKMAERRQLNAES